MVLTEEDIKTWDFQKLKEWLDDPITQENNQFDFIESLQKGNENAQDRIRSKISSFANTNEGFLFFGITDKTKNPVGIKNAQQEFITLLNKIVSKKLFPGIPPQNYKPIHYIKNDNNKDIVVVKIIKSSRNLRPHMTNCKIYIRENGESKPIGDGRSLKTMFSERFFPSDIRDLENDLKNILESENLYHPDLIDFMYLKELRVFLIKQFEEYNSSEYRALIDELHLISEKLEELINKPSPGNLEGMPISILEEERNIKKDLGILINNFIYNYRKVVLNSGYNGTI